MSFSNGINAPKENYGKGRKMISVMDILDEHPVKYEYIRNSVQVNEEIESKNKVEYGDLVFVRSSEVPEEVGWAKAYLEEEYALYSGFSIRGKKTNEFNSHFVELTLNSINRKQIERKAGGSTRFNVSQTILNSLELLVPKIEEQNKISYLFKKLDDTIALHQRKLDQLKELKKAYLQVMFPAKDERVPKVRFADFEEEWELCKLNTIYKKIRNAFVGTATPYYVKEGNFYLESNNIKDGNINQNTKVFINDEFYEKQKDKWLETEDIVMVQSGHVGHTAVIPKELNNTAAHALIMFQERKRETNPYFLNYQFLTDTSKRKLDMITTGNTIKHILASEMKSFEVFVCESAEENLISDFFRKLDDTIALHQNKLEQLKDLKTSYLQNMFI
ncbi:restriction endonuclease subunit S [Enterococcus faecalis]|nr:restriction endonuclease subunit S [Enterococcus faecalis]